MSVQELQTAVTQLPSHDLAQFVAWIEEYQAQAWDRQIEQDIHAGCLNALADQADREFDAGRCQSLNRPHPNTQPTNKRPDLIQTLSTP